MISIIIPVLNEEANIGKLLEHLTICSSKQHITEIIVVDGGSTDQTQTIVNAFIEINRTERKEAYYYTETSAIDAKLVFNKYENAKIALLHADKGRAKQMNVGAKNASGFILYFLHADSFPPKHFDKHIISEVEKGHEAGCFRMQFDSKHWWLKLASWFTQFRWRACRGGDQSLFITQKLFNDIGGYDERYRIYEDNILINELYARMQFVVINKKLITSARMYKKHGIFKLQCYYAIIYLKKWLGADANELYRYYKKRVS